MTSSTAPSGQLAPPRCWRWFLFSGIPGFAGLLSWCFFGSLIYTLLAFPVVEYSGVATTLNGMPLFGYNPFVSGGLTTLLFRTASTALVVAFFILFGRYGVPLYMRGLGGQPSKLRVLLVLVSPIILAAVATEVFAAVLGWQQGEYPKALMQYVGVSLWPFAVVVPLAGILSGLAKPSPAGAPEPDALQGVRAPLTQKVNELVAWIDRIGGVVDPILQGNLLAATLAGVSFAAIVTAGISNDPSVAILLFFLPMVNAVGDLPALYITDRLWKRLVANAGPTLTMKAFFVMIALLLIPGFVVVSLLIVWQGLGAIDAIYGPDALHWRDYQALLLESPFSGGLGVSLMVISPGYWVLLLVGRALFASSEGLRRPVPA